MNITDTPDSLNRLIAENESLKGRLEEYQHMIVMKEKEILELRLQISGDNEIKSNFDNQVAEMELLHNYLSDIELRAEGSAIVGVSHQQNVNIKNQIHDLKQHYTRLQTQLNDLQTQIQNVNNRNLLLQQQNGRIAELESLLEDAEQDRDEWKAVAKLKE
jgi:predicted RNase H-like nuclease (RuvC/YqgF family)